MTLSRTKTWAFGEKLTSDQINAVDANVANALDKRAGQSDTLASAVTVTGATTLSGTTAVNGAMTVTAPITTSNTITTTSGVVFGSGNTVTGNMHLAGTETVDSGAAISVASGGTIRVNSGGTLNVHTGADIQLQGDMEIAPGGVLTVEYNAAINVDSSGTFATASGSIFTINSGTTASIAGATITNPTVSGATISGGTISGATISGGSVGAVSGIATLDSSSKLTASQRAGAFIGCHYATTGSSATNSTSTTSTTYITWAFGQVSFSANAGDVLAISASVNMTMPVATAGKWQIVVNDGGSDVAVGAENYVPSGYTQSPSAITAPYTVSNTGTVVIKLQWKTANSSGSGFMNDSTINATHFRP